MASGDVIFSTAPEFTLTSENETGQNTTEVVLGGYVSASNQVVINATIQNSAVGWPVGESPFSFGKTYSVVITEN